MSVNLYLLGDRPFANSFNSGANNFTYYQGFWTSQERHPRQLADVNGDGRDDIVGFGDDHVWVSLANSNGTFGNAFIGLANQFSFNATWQSQNINPRQLADVNGDGRADIVGFANYGVYVSLANSNGTFADPFVGLSDEFTVLGGGWLSQEQYPRQLADVNGDGRADIVGFANDGVYVSLANSNGTFAPIQLGLSSEFSFNATWQSQNINPRQLADINGDGRADIVGFANDAVYVSLGTTNKNDLLVGGEGNDTIDGLTGNDTLYGQGGNDFLYGRDGIDSLDGDSGNDRLYGGTGNDFLDGDIGNDTLYGEDGNDTLYSWVGRDYLSGGNGNDFLAGQGESDTLYGGQGNDTLSAGGDNFSDFLSGEAGNDLLYAGPGNDTLYGGLGNDTLYGEAGNDTLYAEAGNDYLNGGNGNDYLRGGGYIYNSNDFDILTGGVGNDRFVLGDSYSASSYYLGNGRATITDFKYGEKDKIQLKGSASQYTEVDVNFGVGTAALDTGIYKSGDLIAVLQDVSGSNFILGLNSVFV